LLFAGLPISPWRAFVTRQPDLDIVSDDELISALMSRYDSAVFAGVKDRYRPTGEDEYSLASSGEHLRLLGLCTYLQTEVYKEFGLKKRRNGD
jgi:hypothetical protein